ncbi:unnamed protein product [Amoebophrya sp. A120]|nr:unnamed protein product [Amoebophrya sp. A120]|eukprot:GSA120T00015248001.1
MVSATSEASVTTMSAAPKSGQTVPKIKGFERASFTQKAPRVKYVLPPRAGGGTTSDQSDAYNEDFRVKAPIVKALPKLFETSTAGQQAFGKAPATSLAEPTASTAGSSTNQVAAKPKLFGSTVMQAGSFIPDAGPQGTASSAALVGSGSVTKTSGTGLYKSSGAQHQPKQSQAASSAFSSQNLSTMQQPSSQLYQTTTAVQPVPVAVGEQASGSWLRKLFFGEWGCCQVELARRSDPIHTYETGADSLFA